VVLSGAVLLALAIDYLFSQLIAIFTLPMGTIIVVLGVLTKRPTGVTTTSGQQGSPRLVVDRAVFGASIYELAFFDAKLVLKRLASSRTTVFSVLVLALSGLFVDGLIGGVAGGIGGYAIQEYSTQRNRQMIAKENTFATLARGDLEFPYSDFKEVRLSKNRLFLAGREGLSRISIPRGYSIKIASSLKSLFGGKYKEEESVGSTNASDKQGK
jgi:hypothetical protein